MKQTINALLQSPGNRQTSVAELQKMHGDASARQYFRARLSDGTSCIVMQLPEGKSSASEEITNFTGTNRELPFINVRNFLKEQGLPVPEIFVYSAEHRLMLLEDLGDELLARHVATADDAAQLTWYARAIDLLVSMQMKTRGAPSNTCIALQRSFDETLLNWEFDHFREYGIEARLGITMPSADRATFEAETRRISATIHAKPFGFTHRDFQSRNLIVRDGKLYLIDFQDALLGPAAYDLVALLRDSYVELPPQVVDALIERYALAFGRTFAEVRAEFDLLTIQRKLKDAGRFVFIDRVKKNPNFLPFIAPSLRYVKAAIERLPDAAALYDVLQRYVPEWKG